MGDTVCTGSAVISGIVLDMLHDKVYNGPWAAANPPGKEIKMAVNPYTEARARANKAYDDKTYKKILLTLRYDEDSDMIESLQHDQEHGIKAREWLREMFDGSGISLKDVERVLEKYDVDPRIADKMLKELSGK